MTRITDDRNGRLKSHYSRSLKTVGSDRLIIPVFKGKLFCVKEIPETLEDKETD